MIVTFCIETSVKRWSYWPDALSVIITRRPEREKITQDK